MVFPPEKDKYFHIAEKERKKLYPMSMDSSICFGIFVKSDTPVFLWQILAFFYGHAIMEQSRKRGESMKIIDIHTHVYPEKIASAAIRTVRAFYQLDSCDMDGTAAMLMQRGTEAGISRFVLMPVANRAEQVASINRFIQKQVEENPCFVGFGAIHADLPEIGAEVERIAALGMRGIKVHPDFQKFPIDDPRLFPMYEAVQGKLPVLFHMGDPRYNYSHPIRLRRVLENFPKLEAIAAHFGGHTMQETACELLKDTNCIFDISSTMMFLPKSQVERYISVYGAERLAFGTDYPLWDPVTEVAHFLSLDITAEEKEQIAHKTAERILKL